MRATVEKIVPHLLAKNTSAQAFASSNIALCKYWGKRNRELNLPVNSSLSISLATKGANALIELNATDAFIVNGATLEESSVHFIKLKQYFDLFRNNNAFKLTLDVNIPLAAGLASSACIFAAIAKALNNLFAWQLNAKSLSILARLGSGSAARSIEDGFVLWHQGQRADGLDSFAERLTITWPELRIGLMLLETKAKTVSSRDGMQRTVASSTLYQAWPTQAENDLALLRQALQQKDFDLLGKTAENNALAMHATMMASWPPLLYATAQTIELMQMIWQARANGLTIYFTQDAGPNLKLLFLEKDQPAITALFNNIEIIGPFNHVKPF